MKRRIGWEADNLTGVEVAKQLEAGGADLIAVHGRTREPVSYTHLDVYKRQLYKRAMFDTLRFRDGKRYEDQFFMLRWV